MNDYSQDLRHVGEEAGKEGRAIVGEIQHYVEDFARDGKEKAADRLHHVSESLHRAASKLDEENEPMTGRFAHRAADGIERVSEYLHQHDASDLIAEADRFARRQPLVVIGGALAVGLLVARFLRSGSERSHEQSQGIRRDDDRFDTSRHEGFGMERAAPTPGEPHRVEAGIGAMQPGGMGTGGGIGDTKRRSDTPRPLPKPPRDSGFGSLSGEGGD